MLQVVYCGWDFDRLLRAWAVSQARRRTILARSENEWVHIGMHRIKRVLLTGGGTAGHVNPALAIGSLFASSETRLLFVGVRGKVEEEIVPREGIPIRFVRASGLPEGFSLKLLFFITDLLAGIIQSFFILLGFRPDVIIGTGGYAAAPIIMAAAILRKIRWLKARIFIQEPNAVPGKMNRLMGRFADQVLVTFPETLCYFPENGRLVGYPLRRRIARLNREEARSKLDIKIPQGRKVVFLFGGSQGSRTMNRALVDALGHLLPYRDQLYIIHAVGLFKGPHYHALQDTEKRLKQTYTANQIENIRGFYHYRPYFHSIELVYALTDLVVARAGAGTLHEIAAMGLPALLIPKSNLPGDHQVMNARAVEKVGGAEILYEMVAPVEGKLTEWIEGKTLAKKIIHLLQDENRRREMSRCISSALEPDGLAKIERYLKEAHQAQSSSLDSAQPQIKIAPPPNNSELLALLERAYEEQPASYKPENIISEPKDLEYFKSRAAALLLHPRWQQRNLGVKLIGLLHDKESIPALITLLCDREPVSRFKRLLGGDFVQVGFIRRNIITALIRINEYNPEVEKALLTGLQDPYYEVRAESAYAAGYFSDRLFSRKPFVTALIRLISDPIIEVASAAAEALGKVGGEQDALPVLLSMWNAKFWKVRAGALRGILNLINQGKVSNLEVIEKQVPRFILTSTDFTPQFEIKSIYRELMEAVSAIRKGCGAR